MFKVVANLYNKKRGAKTDRDLTVTDIPRLINMVLTKRLLLGLVMSQYDPMDIICPFSYI